MGHFKSQNYEICDFTFKSVSLIKQSVSLIKKNVRKSKNILIINIIWTYLGKMKDP